jgi:hypothetical protein
MRLSLAAAALGLALAGPAAAQNIGGDYRVQGQNFNGQPYGGVARITLLSETTCRIEWNTGQPSEGICMRHGPVFAASYRAGNATGLAVYEIQRDGTLAGTWTIAGQNGSGRETLIPAR